MIQLSIMSNGEEIPFLTGNINTEYIYEGQRLKISSHAGKITTLLPEIDFLRECGGGFFFHVDNADPNGPEYFMLRGNPIFLKHSNAEEKKTGGRKEKLNRA